MNDSNQSDIDVGSAAFAGENYGEARRIFEKLVATGETQCAINLGWLYESGLGGNKDLERAISMYELGIPSQPQLSNYYLGRALRGIGKTERALIHLEAAAGLGHPSAAYWAHAIHSDHDRQDDAEKFLKRASDLGHVYAKRDQARKSVAKASSIGEWFITSFRYYKIKAGGALLVMKNSSDPRVT